MSYNKVIMMGRLTRDVEMRDLASGTKVAEFGLAVDSGFGENKKVTFIDVTVWSKQAEFVAKFFKKGEPIHVEGRLDLDTWEKDGQKRSKHKLTAERVSFCLGSKSKDPNNSEPIPMDQKKWDANEEQPPF
jgi:single-strand DNA-binding protein